ncbi:mismatch-specific DNA-glycosylase [Alicyclobacillaceae bacterium I2511]|nr:mismatch-specific DNA-glycosylase [Alicyclobacillaceae bacterium I2511]
MITERLREDMRVLFIGFNPSLTSHARGFNYAGKNNRFYPVLFRSGLTHRLYTPEESPYLLEDYGYGFTNIVLRPTARADELAPHEYVTGRAVLRAKLEHHRPRYACYVGKGVYLRFSRKKFAQWGFQPMNEVSGVCDFVAPSTSGLVRMRLEEQVEIYRQLAESLHHDLLPWEF